MSQQCWLQPWLVVNSCTTEIKYQPCCPGLNNCIVSTCYAESFGYGSYAGKSIPGLLPYRDKATEFSRKDTNSHSLDIISQVCICSATVQSTAAEVHVKHGDCVPVIRTLPHFESKVVAEHDDKYQLNRTCSSCFTPNRACSHQTKTSLCMVGNTLLKPYFSFWIIKLSYLAKY